MLGALLSAVLVGFASAAPVAKPNLVLILADDLGYGDLGCYGSTLAPTPNLDRLAQGGVRCTDGYVTAPVCAPSRGGLMTGAYQQRFGMQWNPDRARYRIPESHKLLPETLRAAGYVTGHIGKWNIPRDPTNVFDEVHLLVDWEADYWPGADGNYIGVNRGMASGKTQGWGPKRARDEYLTDRMGQQAVTFIQRHAPGPFFLYLAFNAVHSPWQAKQEHDQKFAHLGDEVLRLYAGMITSLDDNVGRVLDELRTRGLEDNTLIAFVSDNGPARGSPSIVGWPTNWPASVVVGSAGPLRGWKAQAFEGGSRVPLLLRWPAQLQGGHIFKPPVSSFDLYPTFCAAAGATVPAPTKLDGANLLPFLRGEQAGAPHETLFWKWDDTGVVRRGDWKLIVSPEPPKFQLYNLADDLGEQRDLADDKPHLVRQLHQAWLDWSAPFPPPANPNARKKPASAAKPSAGRK